MEQMTAAQKLGRIRVIGALLRALPPPAATPEQRAESRQRLERERAAIMATVGLPPLDLIGNPWGEAWADAFGETFPGFDRDTLLVWFQNACAAGAMKGFEEGKAAGVNERLVEALEAIRDGFNRGQIRCQGMLAYKDEQPEFLGFYIEHALASVAAVPVPAPAVRDWSPLVKKATDVLQRQIVPGGLSDHEALCELHGIFDGPEQRAIAAA